MIWKKKFNPEMMAFASQNTLVGHLGIEITGIEENSLVGYMPVDHRTTQFMGILHGGASAAFAETLGSLASFLVLEEDSGQTVVGTDVQATHIKSVREGKIKGIASPIHLGRRLHVWLIEMFNDKGQLVCHAKLNCMVIDIKQ